MDENDRSLRAGEEAAEWWFLLRGGNLSREEREAFVDWLRDSQTNIAEMLRLAQVHGALSHFKEWDDISSDGTGSQADVIPMPVQRPQVSGPESGNRPRPGSGSGVWRMTFAATLATLTIVVFSMTVVPGSWRGRSIATERGERLEVTLDDGSQVRMDPQTRLRVDFDESVRRLMLTEGRAVFTVAKDAARPFLVEANDTTVRALGTSFGVEHRDQDVVVTVAEGKVSISSASSFLPRTFETTKETTVSEASILLIADQQVTVKKTRHAAPVREVSSDRELAWAEGRLVFRNDPVSKVIAEFNRYNGVQLQVTDPVLAARPVTGVFNATSPEVFVAFIQNTTDVRVERDADRSIVISTAR